MTAKEIIKNYLLDNGYDGLVAESFIGCGCEAEDLMPCDSYCGDCKPAHKVPCPGEEICAYGGGCSFHMQEGKK